MCFRFRKATSRACEADRAPELRREAFLSDATWQELAKCHGMKQRIEIVYTVGGQAMTGLAINSFGIQLDAGLSGDAATLTLRNHEG